MATAQREDKTNIAARVNDEMADNFDNAILEAKMSSEIELGPNASRAEVMRNLMKRAIENPALCESMD